MKKKIDEFQSATDNRLGNLKKRIYSRSKGSVPVHARKRMHELPVNISQDWSHEAEITEKHTPKPRTSPIMMAVFVVAALFLVISVATAGYIFFSGTKTVAPKNIDIQIHGPLSVKSGQILELQVDVLNHNAAELELADLVIGYPAGARAPFDLVTDMKQQRIPLGNIEAGGKRTGTVRAVLLAPSGVQEYITISLEYRLGGGGAIFSTEEVHPILIASDALQVSVEADEKITSGQKLPMRVTVKSTSETELKDVVLKIEYPFGYKYKISSYIPAKEDNFWEVGDLKPGEEYVLDIIGTPQGDSGSDKVFKLQAGLRTVFEDQRVEIPLANFEHIVAIERPFLDMDITYPKGVTDKNAARSGEKVSVEVNWQNNLDTAITDAVIIATLEGDTFSDASVRVAKGFYRSLGKVIIWDKNTTRGDFTSIPARAKGKLTFEVTPKFIEELEGKTNPEIKIKVHARGKRLSENRVPETLQASKEDTVKLATDIDFASKALFFENPFGSRGPLPPKVDYQTTYAIVWTLTNTTNDMEGVKVEAILPPYVKWLNISSPSSENVSYNKFDSKIVWNVGRLDKAVGIGGAPERRLVFQVGLIPSVTQVDRQPDLIKDQTFRGIDSFVDETLILKADDLTTVLDEVDFQIEHGKVIK